MLHLDAGLLHQQFGREMHHAADAGGAEIELAGISLRIGDELLHRVYRQILLRDHDADEFGRQSYRQQVLVEVDGVIVAHRGRNNRRAGIGKQKRVAVRIRLDDLARPDDAGASRLVLDDDRLAEFRAQAFRYDAGHQIGRSAGRERRYQGDLPRWIIFLRDRRRGESGQEQSYKASQHVTISSIWDYAAVRRHLVARPHPVDPYATMQLPQDARAHVLP